MKNKKIIERTIHQIPTAFGAVKVTVTQKGVQCLEFPENSFAAYKKTLTSGAKTTSNKIEKLFTKQIKDYFSGKKVAFTVPVDLDGLTPFEKRVLKELSNVPYGQVITYKELALKVGGEKYAHAVGNALGRNPVPVILPCHRVIKSDKSLGGFSSGITWKRILLAIENRTELV